MTLTLHDIKVWNTGEVIDLVVPSDTDASVDASAMTIAPGFEDPHVHFRDPGQTYKESMISGCAAAASGGYTNVLIMPNTVPAMDGVKVEAGQPGASEVLDAEYDTVIDYLQHYEAAHGVKLPVRYDLCVCASKGRAGHEATEVADWIGYLPEHGDEHKDAYQLAHPVTCHPPNGVLRAEEWNFSGSTVHSSPVFSTTRSTWSLSGTRPRSSTRLVSSSPGTASA